MAEEATPAVIRVRTEIDGDFSVEEDADTVALDAGDWIVICTASVCAVAALVGGAGIGPPTLRFVVGLVGGALIATGILARRR